MLYDVDKFYDEETGIFNLFYYEDVIFWLDTNTNIFGLPIWDIYE